MHAVMHELLFGMAGTLASRSADHIKLVVLICDMAVSLQSMPKDEAGHAFRDDAQRKKAKEIAKMKVFAAMRVTGKGTAKKGEGDRHIPNMMPKHLYSGKRGMGKTDRR